MTGLVITVSFSSLSWDAITLFDISNEVKIRMKWILLTINSESGKRIISEPFCWLKMAKITSRSVLAVYVAEFDLNKFRT